MVQTLLSRVFKSNLLFCLFAYLYLSMGSVYAQSVLLPADLVVVSVNATDDSFDFIPLVKLDSGTQIIFSNGKWDPLNQKIRSTNKIEILVKDPIEPGTNIHINDVVDPRLEVNGKIEFDGDGNRLFAYQIDEGVTRVLYGVGWGHPDVWSSESLLGSEVPNSISTSNGTLVTLGLHDNYQYYLRNGASGTQTMLVNFVGDPAKWRGRDKDVFPPFRTAFRTLSPPVVMFDESISTVEEGNSIVLSVAIFEHDGSRLTVDANFSMYNSTADTSDLKIPKKSTFNFTGLIGNAVYSKEIPINDDDSFESTETAYFELENLSKGNLGDFVSHLALIPDSKIPSIKLAGLSYSGNPDSDFIEIQNNERVEADLSGWKLKSRGFEYTFSYGTYIPAVENIKIYPPEPSSKDEELGRWLKRKSGTLELLNQKDEVVSKLAYKSQKSNSESYSSTEVSASEIPSQKEDVASVSLRQSTVNSVKKLVIPQKEEGWYSLTYDEVLASENTSKKIYYWNEQLQNFERLQEVPEDKYSNSAFLTYFLREELVEKVKVDSIESQQILLTEEELNFTISATDVDENGVINGKEGFNYLKNNTGNSLVVSKLLNQIEEQTYEGAIYPYVYVWSEDGKGWSSASVLSGNDEIPSGSSFWLRADSTFETTQLSVLVSPYVDEVITEDNLEEPNQTLRLRLQIEDFKKDISLTFFESNSPIKKDIINPELEADLMVSDSDFLSFGLGSGLNWNTSINAYFLEDQKMVYPLAFRSSENGTYSLSVVEWENFPLDWNIYIEDLELDKRYTIDQNWSFEFDVFDQKSDEEVMNDEIIQENIKDDELNNGRFNLVIVPPGFEEVDQEQPESVSLHQNYPNPFNPNTIIAFYLPESISVKLSIFNVVGQPVAVLTEGTLSAGDHEFEWDATGLPTGMYIYQLEVGNSVMTRKMTLVK